MKTYEYLVKSTLAILLHGVVMIAIAFFAYNAGQERADALEQKLFVSTGKVEYLDNVSKDLTDKITIKNDDLNTCLNAQPPVPIIVNKTYWLGKKVSCYSERAESGVITGTVRRENDDYIGVFTQWAILDDLCERPYGEECYSNGMVQLDKASCHIVAK